MSMISFNTDAGVFAGNAAKPEPAPVPPPALPVHAAAPSEPLVVEHQSLQASFYYDQHLNRVIITLTSPETGEVVRQIPPEQVQRFMVGMMELAGKLFDARV